MDAATLASDAYNYSLVIDGRIANPKQMIVESNWQLDFHVVRGFFIKTPKD